MMKGANLLVEVMVHPFGELHVLAFRDRANLGALYAVIHHSLSHPFRLRGQYISVL
jgi:hypothetical protein